MMIEIMVIAVKNNHSMDIYEFNKPVVINSRHVTAFKPSLNGDEVDIMMLDGMAYRVQGDDKALGQLHSIVGMGR